MTRRIVDEPPLDISTVKKLVSAEPSAPVPHYLEDLVQQARGLKPLRTAVVHPVDDASLCGAIEAARAQLINPVLIGPEAKIRAAAQSAHLDLSGYELVATEHSHAAAAAGVALARERRVAALM
jgi:phosphate acetyltransferase/phosphate butyryltransferase